MVSEERLKIKYKNIYNKIDKFYNKKGMSLVDSCEKGGVCLSQYYKICNTLGNKGVTGNIGNNKIHQQKGGRNISKIGNEDNDNDKIIFKEKKIKLSNLDNIDDIVQKIGSYAKEFGIDSE